jgi:hypothetical protein
MKRETSRSEGQIANSRQSEMNYNESVGTITDFGIYKVDLIKLDCEGAEYLIVTELSALGLMDRIGWIRGEWHSRKDNLLLANLLCQTHVFNIDPNYPHSVGMFVAHRV